MIEGRETRGTTATNRLRRVDRYLLRHASLGTRAPVVVDLGFGARGFTTIELALRVLKANPDAMIYGVEISRERVQQAIDDVALLSDAQRSLLSGHLEFRHGGFELDVPEPPNVVRAFNVLRQYDEVEVAPIWRRMQSKLAPGGVVIDGTSNEIGRVASWVDVRPDGPEMFTFSLALAGLEHPEIIAERLPKALIHRNVPGERIHLLLRDLARAWAHNSGYAAFGTRQRFEATIEHLQDSWPIATAPRLWRTGEVSVPWDAVAPDPKSARLGAVAEPRE